MEHKNSTWKISSFDERKEIVKDIARDYSEVGPIKLSMKHNLSVQSVQKIVVKLRKLGVDIPRRKAANILWEQSAREIMEEQKILKDK